MNAFKQIEPREETSYIQQQPKQRRHSRRNARKRAKSRRHPYKGIAAEVTVKLLVNGILSVAAIAALVKLLPYHLAQQIKLEELDREVVKTEQRVEQLRQQFNQNFSLDRNQIVRQEQANLFGAKQKKVILQNQE